MSSGIGGIDHVVLGIRNLERAKNGWARLGFTLSPRGRHIGQPTANYCVMFAGEYIELMGAAGKEESEGRLGAFLERREGAMRVAFAPRDSPEAVREALLRLGCHPSPPRALGREISLAEGSLLPRFRLIDLSPEDTPGLESFLCFHLTSELIRRREWLLHPNGALGLKGIDVLVAETASLLGAYDRLFGLSRVTTTDAVAAVEAGRHRITFLTPDDFLTIHPGIAIPPDFPLPGIVALELEIARREKTVDYLKRVGIAFDEPPDGGLAVGASEANGAILFFSER